MVKRVLVLFIAIVMCFAFITGCNKKEDKNKNPQATEKPVPDEAETTEYVAIVGGEKIYTVEYKYFLYNALTEIDFSELDIPDDATQKQQYDIMMEYLLKEDENGKTNLDKAKDRALELCTLFKVTFLEGKKAGLELTDEEKETTTKEISDHADQALATYGGQYADVKTRDDIMRKMYSMNVKDYTRFAFQQQSTSNYAKDVIGKMKPTDEELKTFYDENEDTYRIVTVRHILFLTQDEEGKALSAEEKAKKYEKAEKVKKKVEEGDDIEALVKGYSEDTYLDELGIYEVSKNSGYVKEFEEWALKQKEVTDVVEIIESSFGYHVMMCEGIKTFEDKTVKENVTTAYNEKNFDKSMKDLIDEKKYEVTETNQELINKATDEFMDVLFTPEPEPTATPEVSATPAVTPASTDKE